MTTTPYPRLVTVEDAEPVILPETAILCRAVWRELWQRRAWLKTRDYSSTVIALACVLRTETRLIRGALWYLGELGYVTRDATGWTVLPFGEAPCATQP